MKVCRSAEIFSALSLLALYSVSVYSQYHSHFYATEPKWYQAFLLDENATTVYFRESYSFELAQIHCGRKCSRNEFCEVFSITGEPGSWMCILSNNSYCNPNQTNVLLPGYNSATWDKLQDITNNGSNCIQRSGILNLASPNEYCPYIRPGCYGENCTECHKSCSDCFTFKNMTNEVEHECTLWFSELPSAPPTTRYKCYGPRSYVWVRKVDRNNGYDMGGWTLNKPRLGENFTWIQNRWTGGTARFVFSGSPDMSITYNASYNNFRISEQGNLSMRFLNGDAGDGFAFGNNTDGNVSLQFIWPPSGCGPYWYKTYDASCPSDRVSLWDDRNVSSPFFGIRWPTLNLSEGIAYFRLLFY